ncbi:MAG: PQQ-like beta-propeller repeat protein, partial [Planctomycetales bacterium]
MKSICTVSLALFSLLAFFVPGSLAEDWPMWRYDAERSAVSPGQLPTQLHLQWSRQYAAPKPAWPEDPRLMFDASYEPIVVGTTMYLSSAQTDSVTAIDTQTGEEKWQFFAEAPIRFAPVASGDRLYFGADDGCMYCVRADEGSLIWKFDTASSVRNVLGNDRLVSVWPVRGGPVLSPEGKLYFTAGVWPFEGTFLYTLDAESKEQLDKQDGTPPEFSVLTLTDMTPQGYLVLSGKRLYMPCGRAAVGIHETGTKFYKALGYNARGLTDYHATASGPYLFHGHRVIDMDENRTLPINAPRPVSDGSEIYLAQSGNVVAADILKQPEPNPEEIKKGILPKFKATWHVKGQQIIDALGPVSATRRTEGPLTVDIRSGDRVYGRYGNVVYAAEGPQDGKPAGVSWATVVDGDPTALVAANDRLFVATHEGKILCYGAEKGAARVYPATEAPLDVSSHR